MEKRQSIRTGEQMKDVLLDQTQTGPDVHYYMFRGGAQRGNITLWEMGVAGREYIKTYGHFHNWDFTERYQIISGEGIALMQKRKVIDGVTQDNIIDDFKVIRVQAGDILDIPIGYGHILSNTGDTFLITKDDSPSDPETAKIKGPHANYEPIKKLKGFAYYVVKTEGGPALITNPLYTVENTDFSGLSVIE